MRRLSMALNSLLVFNWAQMITRARLEIFLMYPQWISNRSGVYLLGEIRIKIRIAKLMRTARITRPDSLYGDPAAAPNFGDVNRTPKSERC